MSVKKNNNKIVKTPKRLVMRRSVGAKVLSFWKSKRGRGDNEIIAATYNLSKATVVSAITHGLATPNIEGKITEYFQNKPKAA